MIMDSWNMRNESLIMKLSEHKGMRKKKGEKK